MHGYPKKCPNCNSSDISCCNGVGFMCRKCGFKSVRKVKIPKEKVYKERKS